MVKIGYCTDCLSIVVAMERDNTESAPHYGTLLKCECSAKERISLFEHELAHSVNYDPCVRTEVDLARARMVDGWKIDSRLEIERSHPFISPLD